MSEENTTPEETKTAEETPSESKPEETPTESTPEEASSEAAEDVSYDFTGEVVQLAEPPMFQIIITRFPQGHPEAGQQRVMSVVVPGETLPDVLFHESDEANQHLLEGLNRLQQGLMAFPEGGSEKTIHLDLNYEVVED